VVPRTLVMTFLTVAISAAPTHAQQPVAATPAPPPAEPAASALISVSRATTYKFAALSANMMIFSWGTGGVTGGAAMSVYNFAKSWGLAAVNEYGWDYYWPAPTPVDGKFDAQASLWRSTQKLATYRPVDTVFKILGLYAWGLPVNSAVTLGLASATSSTVIFYVNGFTWDLLSIHPAATALRP